MDITLKRLKNVGKVCVLAARTYGDHCAKVASCTTLASLDKAGCAHIDALATCVVVVATVEESVNAERRICKASKVLVEDYWARCGHEDATGSFRAVQVKQTKGKVPTAASVEVPEGGKRGSTYGDKV